MSAITIEKNHVTKRKEEVAAITAKHSQKLFGHSNATIKEVRYEAIKRNLEAIFTNS